MISEIEIALTKFIAFLLVDLCIIALHMTWVARIRATGKWWVWVGKTVAAYLALLFMCWMAGKQAVRVVKFTTVLVIEVAEEFGP